MMHLHSVHKQQYVSGMSQIFCSIGVIRNMKLMIFKLNTSKYNMNSFVIHAGHEDGSIKEKKYITRVTFFFAIIATFMTCTNYIVYTCTAKIKYSFIKNPRFEM